MLEASKRASATHAICAVFCTLKIARHASRLRSRFSTPSEPKEPNGRGSPGVRDGDMRAAKRAIRFALEATHRARGLSREQRS
jgi:hypothetical protein